MKDTTFKDEFYKKYFIDEFFANVPLSIPVETIRALKSTLVDRTSSVEDFILTLNQQLWTLDNRNLIRFCYEQLKINFDFDDIDCFFDEDLLVKLSQPTVDETPSHFGFESQSDLTETEVPSIASNPSIPAPQISEQLSLFDDFLLDEAMPSESHVPNTEVNTNAICDGEISFNEKDFNEHYPEELPSIADELDELAEIHESPISDTVPVSNDWGEVEEVEYDFESDSLADFEPDFDNFITETTESKITSDNDSDFYAESKRDNKDKENITQSEEADYPFDPNKPHNFDGFDDFEEFENDFFEDIVEPPTEVLLDKIDDETRVTQKAVEFVVRNKEQLTNNNDACFLLVREIFTEYGYSATKTAIQRLVNDFDVSVQDLRKCFELKQLWENSYEFWISIGKHREYNYSHRVISWQVCYRILYAYHAVPDAEEVGQALYVMLEQWHYNDHLQRIFPSFARFVWTTFANPDAMPHIGGEAVMFDVDEYSPEDWEDSFDTINYQQDRAFNEWGLYQHQPVQRYYPIYHKERLEKLEDEKNKLANLLNSANENDSEDDEFDPELLDELDPFEELDFD